jgi:4-amino-4-deoxy-L-arabinose transferase-like glycosyltransferase
VLVAVAVSLHAWIQPVHWKDPDALYYQAKTLSYRGEDERAALFRTFRGPLAAEILAAERESVRKNPDYLRHYTNPKWIDYSSRFFHRRIFVSLAAAGIYPLFGERSVLTVSLVGYLLLSFALFAFMRRRFGPLTSGLVAAVCLLAPPLREWSFIPMTDSWGLLLETCALLAAVLVYDRGTRWLAAWVGAMALVSITRDTSIIPLVAVACLCLHQRDRRSLLLLGSGVAAILPALLLWGNASIRGNLAFAFSGFNPPYEETWKFVLHYYPRNLEELLRGDFNYGSGLGLEAPFWYLGLALALIGVGMMVWRLRRADPFFRLATYSLVGAVVYVGLFGRYSEMRQELAFIPGLAVALAVAGESGVRYVRARLAERQGLGAAEAAPNASAMPG